MTALAVAPLAVWDCRSGDHRTWEHRREAVEWSARNLPDQGHDTYRLEFYLVDAPFAKAFRYATNEQGHRYFDPATDWAAVKEPVIVVLSDLPPPHLMVFQ